jgi:hypothetical protein
LLLPARLGHIPPPHSSPIRLSAELYGLRRWNRAQQRALLDAHRMFQEVNASPSFPYLIRLHRYLTFNPLLITGSQLHPLDSAASQIRLRQCPLTSPASQPSDRLVISLLTPYVINAYESQATTVIRSALHDHARTFVSLGSSNRGLPLTNPLQDMYISLLLQRRSSFVIGYERTLAFC